jgi:hypothetical protein
MEMREGSRHRIWHSEMSKGGRMLGVTNIYGANNDSFRISDWDRASSLMSSMVNLLAPGYNSWKYRNSRKTNWHDQNGQKQKINENVKLPKYVEEEHKQYHSLWIPRRCLIRMMTKSEGANSNDRSS